MLAIKLTLYRTSGDSPIVRSLIRAAERGKQVAALVELKARFDESANIEWARRWRRAGVHVVYGLVGLKTHTKTALVVRDEADGIRRYCHIGTGNYNSKTARLYEDLGLLTCDPAIGADLTQLFNYLTGYGRNIDYERAARGAARSAPGADDLIQGEIDAAAAEPGRAASSMKMNSLVDAGMIDELYEASQAGVEIDLIVRGICCLAPGRARACPRTSGCARSSAATSSTRASTASPTGRRPGQPIHLIGSADLMPRNLDRRVEALTPVTDPELQARLRRGARRQPARRHAGLDARRRRRRWTRSPPGGDRRGPRRAAAAHGRPGRPAWPPRSSDDCRRRRRRRSPAECHSPLVPCRPWTQHCSSWRRRGARRRWGRGLARGRLGGSRPPPRRRRGRGPAAAAEHEATVRAAVDAAVDTVVKVAGERFGAQAEAGSRELASRQRTRSSARWASCAASWPTSSPCATPRSSGTWATCGSSCPGSPTSWPRCSASGPSSTARSRPACSEMAAVSARLADTTQSLRQALANPKARGQWGERMADDVLRAAGLVEGISYRKQSATAAGTIPDFTFLLPGGRVLHMDVKFPVDNYLRYLEAHADRERDQHAVAFVRDVRARVRELSGRVYIDPDDTLDEVLLFIPNEAVYAFVHQHDRDLVEVALRQKVVLCSPCTLFSVLAVIRQAVEQTQLQRTSDEILGCLAAFETQWGKFADALDKVGRSLDTVRRSWDDLSGTRRRQLERAARPGGRAAQPARGGPGRRRRRGRRRAGGRPCGRAAGPGARRRARLAPAGGGPVPTHRRRRRCGRDHRHHACGPGRRRGPTAGHGRRPPPPAPTGVGSRLTPRRSGLVPAIPASAGGPNRSVGNQFGTQNRSLRASAGRGQTADGRARTDP